MTILQSKTRAKVTITEFLTKYKKGYRNEINESVTQVSNMVYKSSQDPEMVGSMQIHVAFHVYCHDKEPELTQVTL